MKKKDTKYILIICLLVCVLVTSFLLSNKVFGSQIDWTSQHIAYPDYFRKLFYETGNLFPNFSINLGAGENIFYFSYYGLFNPIIMFSYLLPFISMKTYIIATSFLGILASMILIYYFLKDKVGEELSFISSILYLLAGPIIFQAHRHIMFTNYMPFLILGLIGIDKYFKNKKSILLLVSTLLMILTSYYYSISGIVVFIIYGTYLYLKNNEFKLKDFFKEEIKFIVPIILAILLSCFFLLPTAYSLLSGRVGNINDVSLSKLLIPNFNISDYLYSNYSIGLTVIFILAIIYFILNNKKENRFLGITLAFICLIPVGVYLLNGTLYARYKTFIPFLPLGILMVSLFIKNLDINKIHKVYWLILLIILMIINIFYPTNIFFLVDFSVTLLSIILYTKYNNKNIIYIPLIILALVNVFIFNDKEKYLEKSYNSNDIEKLVNKIDNSLYRTSIQNDTLYGLNKIYSYNQLSTSLYSSTYNSNYYDFYTKVFDNSLSYRNKLMLNTTKNNLFETLMGEKYIVRKCNNNLLNYNEISRENEYCLYENDNVFTIGYGTSNLYSKDYFESLEYPYNIELLLNGVVVDKEINNFFETKIKEIKLNGIINNKEIEFDENKTYKLSTDKEEVYKLSLNENYENKIMIIEFNLLKSESCSVGDTSISINGVKNKLTCTGYEYDNKNNHMTYVLNYNNLKDLTVTFSKGSFEISNIKAYIIDNEIYKNLKNNIYEFTNIRKNDNLISGEINMLDSGYFNLSIPYDNGFTITVDNKKIDYEKTNTAFIGFKLDKGKHKITVKYNSPLYKEGKIISITSFVLVLVLIIIKKGDKKWME